MTQYELQQIDNQINKQNKRLQTWAKHKTYVSQLTGKTAEIEEYKTLQNMYTALLNRRPELREYFKTNDDGEIISISRSKAAKQALSESGILNWRSIENTPTYRDVYNKYKKELEQTQGGKLKAYTDENGERITVKQQINEYIQEQSDITKSLNAMQVLYAIANEKSENYSKSANEILDILRGEEKGGKRKYKKNSDKYKKITPKQWAKVTKLLGIVTTESRYKKALEKEMKKGAKI